MKGATNMPSVNVGKSDFKKLELIAYYNNVTILELIRSFIDYEYNMMISENVGKPEIVTIQSTLKKEY